MTFPSYSRYRSGPNDQTVETGVQGCGGGTGEIAGAVLRQTRSSQNPGIGAGFIPDVVRLGLVEEIMKVAKEDSGNTAPHLAGEEGILCGSFPEAAVRAATAYQHQLLGMPCTPSRGGLAGKPADPSVLAP